MGVVLIGIAVRNLNRSITLEICTALSSTPNLTKSDKPDYYPLKTKKGRSLCRKMGKSERRAAILSAS